MSYLVLLIVIASAALTLLVFRVVQRRSWIWKVPAFVIATLLGLFSVAVVAFFLLGHLMCGEYVFPSIYSPDGQFVARVSEFDCGAVSPFDSEVDVLPSRNFLSLMHASTYWRSHAVFVDQDDPRLIQVAWTGNDELTIHFPKSTSYTGPHQCSPTWHEVRIRCQEYSPDRDAKLPELPSVSRWLW